MSPKIGANTLCPCGSGQKYKRCCRDSAYDADPQKRVPLPIPRTRLHTEIIHRRSRTRLLMTKDILFNQLLRDSPKIAADFDLLCTSQLQELNDCACDSMGMMMQAFTSEKQGLDDEFLFAALALLQNAHTSFLAAVELVRRGFRVQPGILVRTCLENLSTLCHLMLVPADLQRLKSGDIPSTKTVSSANKILPPFGRIYGFFSRQFVHMSRLHLDQLNPLTSYKKDDQALQMNLLFLRSTIWLITVVAELALMPLIENPRFWREVQKGGYQFSPAEGELDWMKDALKEERDT